MSNVHLLLYYLHFSPAGNTHSLFLCVFYANFSQCMSPLFFSPDGFKVSSDCGGTGGSKLGLDLSDVIRTVLLKLTV